MSFDLSICEKPVVDLEKSVMQYWRDENIFRKSVEQRPQENQYVLYDGPPFATGLPHYGHILAHSIKDVFPRYHTMQGKRVERRFGWDCHGVPVEFEAQKRFQIEGTVGIEKLGIAKFNETCRSIVLQFTKEWEATEERLGRFVDMKNDYKTMDKDFMQSVWSVFARLYEKGLVYEDKKVLAYSPELGTPLSDFEAKLNYKLVKDPAVTLSFPLVDEPNTCFLVWTTTPWSVPTNIALAVNPGVNYVKVEANDGKFYVVAKSLMNKFFTEDDYKAVEDVSVETYVGKRYQPMFNVLSEQESRNGYVVTTSAHVTDKDGTGIVHISPAHGEDDYKVGKLNNLQVLDFADRNCVFVDERSPESVKGLFFKDADKKLVELMLNTGRLFKQEEIEHEYPFCWRTEKPLMYRCAPSWYISVSSIRDKLIANNKKINWYPDFVGAKRFHNMLETAGDWSVSRSRYWGCPMPIWRNVKDPSDIIIVKSASELESLTGEKVEDLHRHFIDQLVVQKDGKTYERIPEVFDCWFESGSMPYAQAHYMFDNDESFLRTYPADFIAEGVDQTRGWFYTLNVLSTALYDKPAFKNCVVNGILLGDDGKKMSKSKGNYPNMDKVFEKYGADGLRLFLLGSSATCADEIAVHEKEISAAIKNVILPILNMYKYFATYANKFDFKVCDESMFESLKTPLDKWLFYRTEMFKARMTKAYEGYDLVAVGREIREFVEELSNWYLHYGRKLFSKDEVSLSKTKLQSFGCLAHALKSLSMCAAPVIPFISEVVYQALEGKHASVHLQYWPKSLEAKMYAKDFDEMVLVRKMIHLGQRVREENVLRLKQPLQSLYLDSSLAKHLAPHEDLLKEALNVKEIVWVNGQSDFLQRKIKLNENVMGKRYRAEYREMAKAFNAGKYDFNEKDNSLVVCGKTLAEDDFCILMKPKEGFCFAESENCWVLLDATLTPALLEEGAFRDFMSHLQKARKSAGLRMDQRVDVCVDSALRNLLERHGDFILKRTNSVLIFNAADDVAPRENVYQGNFTAGSFKGVLTLALRKDKEEEKVLVLNI